MPPPRLRARWTVPLSLTLSFVVCRLLLGRPSLSCLNSFSFTEPYGKVSRPESALAEDILVILRTGATEALEKVPPHFQSTLRNVPHYVVFSDFEEVIEGHRVYDVLDEVSDKIKRTNPDFQLYNKLAGHGRDAIRLPNSAHTGSGPAGSLDNPGWKLDKWKFLPMIDKALQYRPAAKWFVFIEADTYLIWSNLLAYLDQFDPSKPYYIGKHMYIGDVLFAHGGAGFVISNPAMRRVSEHRATRVAEYDQFTQNQWAGDCVLGKILKDVGIDLFWAFPHFQQDVPSLLDYNTTKIGRTVWCFPTITFHHVQPQEMETLGKFEQTWTQQASLPYPTLEAFV